MALQCPTCSQTYETTIETLNAHVASHYEDVVDPLREPSVEGQGGSGFGSGSSSFKRKRSQDSELAGHSSSERNHTTTVSGPDDAAQGLNSSTNAKSSTGLPSQSNPPPKQKGFTNRGSRREKGDDWWSPVDCPISELPSNFTPGLIPVLRKVLLAAHEQGLTRRAVLCAEGVCHIRSSRGFDNGWGCGYRNLEMALTALLVAAPHYRPIFPSVDEPGYSNSPGVRNLQIWMEAAWKDGYDEQGREQLGGKMVGTKKWIGPADMYPTLAPKGIPCYLHDFARPPGVKEDNSSTTLCSLIEYVERYFDEGEEDLIDTKDGKPKTAFDRLMKSGTFGAVRMTNKLPLIFQHDGHSRTIVGYEVSAQGKTNLLLFDPGHDIPKDLRRSAIEGFAHRVDPDAEALSESGASTDNQADDGPIEIHSDEEVTRKGWVKKKANKMKEKAGRWREVRPEWETKPLKALKEIRVNPNELSKYPEFQLLRFTGGPLLSQTERDSRRVISSERMT